MSFACARARRAILARDVGALSPDRTVDLARHLATCPACATHADAEARLTERLAAVARGASPAIDVRARVLREIAACRPAPERAPLGWAAGIAALAALALVAWLEAAWPTMIEGLRQAGTALDALRVVGAAFLAALAPIAAWLVAGGETLAKVIGSLAPLVRAAVPIVTTLLVVAALATAATIAFAVGRDVVRAPRLAVPEEP